MSSMSGVSSVSTHESDDTIDSFAPPKSPTAYEASGVDKYLPGWMKDRGITLKIKVQQARCREIEHIEAHVETQIQSLRKNEKILEDDLSALQHAVKAVASIIADSLKSKDQLNKNLKKVRKKLEECKETVVKLGAAHVEELQRLAADAASSKAREEVAKARKAAGIR
jgi:peptidoglycan hydrolase CwlO-like protein